MSPCHPLELANLNKWWWYRSLSKSLSSCCVYIFIHGTHWLFYKRFEYSVFFIRQDRTTITQTGRYHDSESVGISSTKWDWPELANYRAADFDHLVACCIVCRCKWCAKILCWCPKYVSKEHQWNPEPLTLTCFQSSFLPLPSLWFLIFLLCV